MEHSLSGRNVTGKEVDVDPNTTIVSKTDLAGKITFVNDPFVRISGYTKDELIGQSHNIMRHPEVPSEVFKDLWDTIELDKPWVQLVKNRCKNGDHYWVESNVCPIHENGATVGYLSVRRKISDRQKAAAEELYKDIHAGRKRIKSGYVESSFDRISVFDHVNPLMTLVVLIGLMSIAGILDALSVFSMPWYVQLVILSIFLTYALYINHQTKKRIASFEQMLKSMSEADFSKQVYTYGDTWVSKLAGDLKKMQIQMGSTYEESRSRLHFSLRLTTALDNASTSVMVVNRLNQIIYVNNSMKELLARNMDKLEGEFPMMQANGMVGRNLDCFNHSNSGLQLFSMDQQEHAEKEFSIAGIILKTVKQPVINDKDECIGAVIEWTDVSQQRKVEKTIDDVLKMAAKGHTDIRVDTEGLDGFYLYSANNINLLLKSLNSAIEDMVLIMVDLANGNMQSRMDKNLNGALDAMKGATNVSLENLSGIILQMKEVSVATVGSARESSQAANDLSDRTQVAAATLQEVNASMQTINGMQQENTTALTEVATLANTAMDLNQEARVAMDSSIKAMSSITETSEKIEAIIGLIDGIAFQTNLLALNAAVEAARAGEHGRGFAVVAGEVRTLAQKSAEAAKDIKNLIQESGEKVKEGSSKVQATHAVFTEVDSGVAQISSTLKEVVGSINEQQRNVDQITTAVEELDNNLQSNAALVEESSATAVALTEQAEVLDHEVQKFQLSTEIKQKNFTGAMELHGVNLTEIRQKMRLWRINAQAYLNGVNVPFDEVKGVDPKQCAVGMALKQLVSSDPSIQSLPIWKIVEDLHYRQHNSVKIVLTTRDEGDLNIDRMELIDEMVQEFVSVTEELDSALGQLEQDLYNHSSGSEMGSYTPSLK